LKTHLVANHAPRGLVTTSATVSASESAAGTAVAIGPKCSEAHQAANLKPVATAGPIQAHYAPQASHSPSSVAHLGQYDTLAKRFGENSTFLSDTS